MSPTIGRVVHYYARDFSAEDAQGSHGPYAAIVTEVGIRTLNLAVFKPGMPPRCAQVRMDPDPDHGPDTWCWPPRT